MLPVVFTLTPPPSVNELFGQASGRKRFMSAEYKAWTRTALWELKALKIEPVTAPFYIEIFYEDVGRFDLNNRDKAVLDVLKKAGIIKDDSRKWFRQLHLYWNETPGMQVRISAAKGYHCSYTGE